MDKKSLETKTIRKYWLEVIRRAVEPVLGELAMRAVGVLFFLALIVLITSAIMALLGIVTVPFFAERLEEFKSILNTSLWTVAVMIGLILIGIYRSAPEMHNELGGFIEMPFKLVARPPLQKFQDESRWASITVVNASPFEIRNCCVTLDNILNQNGESVLDSRQRKLLWSSGEGPENRDRELDIVPFVPRVCDVATTSPNNREMSLTTWMGQEAYPMGNYEVIISVHGEWKNIYRHETCHFIVEYAGGNILTIIEKGKEKWKNPNPFKMVSHTPQMPHNWGGGPSS
jgi:hypothetical protein